MKIYISFALLIFMVTPSLAEVYKCKVNGKLVYSQIRCADDGVKMNIIRYTPPTPEDIYKQKLAAQQGEIDKQKQAAESRVKQFEQRKNYLINEINNVDLGKDLLNSRAYRKNLQNELKMLEREHLATIDPSGSTARLLEDSVDELKEEVRESARRSQNYTVIENGRTKYCQKLGTQVTCN